MNEVRKIVERIVEQMKKKGISYRTLADKTGIPKSALQRYISGETAKIPIDRIEAMAKCFGVSAAYLMCWTDDEYEFYDNLSNKNTELVINEYEYYEVPRYDSCAAGFGVVPNSAPIGTDMLPFKSKSEARETMTITVRGDSMYPKIEDGDIIAVKRTSSVDSGTVAVVLIDNEDAVVKKVIYGDDWITLHSFNPEYMDREFKDSEVQRIQIVGKVTKVIKEI